MYSVAPNITEYHIVINIFFLGIIYDDKAIISCKKYINGKKWTMDLFQLNFYFSTGKLLHEIIALSS